MAREIPDLSSERPTTSGAERIRKFLTPKRVLGVAALAVGIGFANKYLISEPAVGIKDANGQIVAEWSVEDVLDGNMNDPVQIKVERPKGMTLDNSTPDVNQFFNDRYFTDQERIDWAYNVLNQPSTDPEHVGMTLLEAHHSELQEKYNKPGEFKYVEDLVMPSEEMTGDEIFALFAAIADVQLNADLPLDTRLKFAAAHVDNNTGGLDYTLDNLKNGNVMNLNGLSGVNVDTNGQKLESKVFRHHVLSNGYNPVGIPSKIMDAMTTNNDSPIRFQTLIQFRDGKPITFDGYAFQSSEALDADDILSIPAN